MIRPKGPNDALAPSDSLPTPNDPVPTTYTTRGDLFKRVTPKTVGRVAQRVCLYAHAAWGKTTFAAHCPNVHYIEAQDERGTDVPMKTGRIPEIDLWRPDTWKKLLEGLAVLHSEPLKEGEEATIALDTLDGFERMCHEHETQVTYGGDGGEKGFLGWQRGYKTAIREWQLLLKALERLWLGGWHIVALCQPEVTEFNDPLGIKYDRYAMGLHVKTRAVTTPWFDTVLFGTTMQFTEEDGKKLTDQSGKDRIVHTTRCDAYDAKHRGAMSSSFTVEEGYENTFPTIWSELTHGLQ